MAFPKKKKHLNSNTEIETGKKTARNVYPAIIIKLQECHLKLDAKNEVGILTYTKIH